MRIRKIQIDEFGLWRNLHLELNTDQLTVLYGPNETGKSTLLRFIRGVLYGFDLDDSSDTAACGGMIEVVDGDELLSVRRSSAAGSRGHLGILDVSDVGESRLQQLLQVGEGMFRGVFAIGLEELQRLATLRDGEVGEFIYDATLGPVGKRLISACRVGEQTRRAFVSRNGSAGVIPELLAKITAIDGAIGDLGNPLDQHAELAEEVRAVEDDIEDQERRIDGLKEQLRGHELLERVWRPWQRQRQLQADINALNEYQVFPDNGISQLEQFDQDEMNLVGDCRRLRQMRRRIHAELKQISADAQFSQHAESIRDLLECWRELAPLEDEQAAFDASVQTRQRAIDQALSELGSNWNRDRVQALDTTPATTSHLFAVAAEYRAAMVKRRRFLRRYQAVTSKTQQTQVALNLRIGGDIEEMRERLVRQVATLDDLGRTYGDAVVARRTVAVLEEQLEQEQELQKFPPYFFMALAVFGLGGIVLATLGVIGFFRGWNSGTPILIGAIFSLLGFCCAGVAWTMKRQFDPGARENDRFQGRLADAQQRRAELEEQLEDLAAELDDDGGSFAVDEPASAEVIRRRRDEASARLADLERAAREQEVLVDRRRRLSGMRERIRELQRDVAHARREWCTTLEELRLEESLRTNEILDFWTRAGQCRLAIDAADAAKAVHAERQRSLGRFWARVEKVATHLGVAPERVDNRRELLAAWRRQLDEHSEQRDRRGELRSRFKEARREFSRAAARLRNLRAERQALLAAGQAHDKEEFRERHAQYLRRRQLVDQLDGVRADLDSAAAEHADLAVVEEDLIHFDETENRHAVATIRAELSDLEDDVRSSHEQLGRLQRQLEVAAADQRLLDLRFERAQLAAELEHAVERLESARLASDALEGLRNELEQRSQPRTLRDATDYLVRLTDGRYDRVWTPIGERRLIVEESSGRAFSVEQLSNGTREQLYLSIRLALIENLRADGVQLPLILDDVLVNFDEVRTNAAVETLHGVAAGGQQIVLFTCHRHLANAFESLGADLIELPGYDPLARQRRVG